VQRISRQQNLRRLQPSLTKRGSRNETQALQRCSRRFNGSYDGNEEGNNQQNRLDGNAKENSRLYYLMSPTKSHHVLAWVGRLSITFASSPRYRTQAQWWCDAILASDAFPFYPLTLGSEFSLGWYI
jgi:hypothetical protein